MENLVDKIVEINRAASEKVKAAEKKKEAAEKKLESEKQKLISEISSIAKARLERFEQSQKSEADAEIKTIQDNLQNDKHRLQKIFDENNEKWVQQLVNQVLEN